MTSFLIILILLFSLYAGLILYLRKAWNSIPPYFPGQTEKSELPFLSVIVPARNEEKNIAACLEALAGQDYPADRFEVLVVDDHSEDGTGRIIRAFSTRIPNIHYISLQEHTVGQEIRSHKKKAIETGIANSRGELIITTDADCRSGKSWLLTIASAYREREAVCLVMPVRIRSWSSSKHQPYSALAMFQTLDVMTLQGITGVAIDKQWLGMCNGANFAYTRKAYTTVDGFQGNQHIASGDDMFLLHKITKAYPRQVLYIKSKEVIVDTGPEETIKNFLNQRIRWAGKSAQYKDKRILPVLILVYLLNLSLLIGLTLPLWNLVAWYSYQYLGIILVLLLKTMVEWIYLLPVGRFFHQSRLLPWFPCFQIPHIIYTVVAGWLGMIGRYQWKGRRVQ